MGRNKEYYIVTNEGEVIFRSEDEEVANAFAEKRSYDARRQAMEEMGLDEDASEEEIDDADFMAGYGGGTYDVDFVVLTGLEDDDEVELDDGGTVTVSDIMDAPTKFYDDDEF